MPVDIFKQPLIDSIGRKRFSHSVRVMKTATDMALAYGVPVNKTRIAAILHDCGRLKDCRSLIEYFNERNIILDSATFLNTNLHHAVLGRFLAYDRFCITDIDILNAIRYHTTGRANMTILEKIIYLADAIEPKREYEGVWEIRKMAMEDLDEAMIMSLVNTCGYLERKNTEIHKNTLKCLGWLENKRTGGKIGKQQRKD
ncbi:putative HD superfamily hydrolase of NAD metabolism [Dethiosulfatibacter aminovorans DSM 17477]|uniref:bis(5'-nucleosyl)-tetraphosphatase (symmetrical) n=1 Tax=Dethiosulfatibacter aminovorans DSM 17477 TaxID=1121476 RepID=A0A1M6CYF7_9FIRM|nr:bis(5'-nucleosyl)-tetraphosphatase (symmetrical) YqeK [Dethiosulfatibacter aminovorans]SHI66000.1 putative HD superfamily hydrolase of NAD metabolism [Dethiosulfatibacter aminovorans DSM 17477]